MQRQGATSSLARSEPIGQILIKAHLQPSPRRLPAIRRLARSSRMPPHQPRRNGKEMSPVLPVHLINVDQLRYTSVAQHSSAARQLVSTELMRRNVHHAASSSGRVSDKRLERLACTSISKLVDINQVNWQDGLISLPLRRG